LKSTRLKIKSQFGIMEKVFQFKSIKSRNAMFRRWSLDSCSPLPTTMTSRRRLQVVEMDMVQSLPTFSARSSFWKLVTPRQISIINRFSRTTWTWLKTPLSLQIVQAKTSHASPFIQIFKSSKCSKWMPISWVF
jgi:hypothetical protein